MNPPKSTVASSSPAKVEVSNLLKETSKDYIDALRAEIESATQELSHQLEKYYIIGNAGLNAKEFDGLSNLVSHLTRF